MAESKLKQLGVGRRQPNDALFAAGDRLCRLYVREGIISIDDEQLCHQVVAVFPCEVPGCKETFASLLDFEMHYNSRHRFICRECRKPLPSAHFLDLHICETHDSFFAAQAERKPMYRCFVEECNIMSQDATQRRDHCIQAHNFPHDFRFDQSLKKSKNRNSKEPKAGESQGEAMMVDESQEKKPSNKPITFGRGRGKTFSMKPWHTKGKREPASVANNGQETEISTAELMEVLPS